MNHATSIGTAATKPNSYIPAINEVQRLLERAQSLKQTGEGFFHYAMRLSREHHAAYLRRRISPARLDELETMVVDSWDRQRAIEASPQVPLETYLQRYFAQR